MNHWSSGRLHERSLSNPIVLYCKEKKKKKDHYQMDDPDYD